MCVGVCVGVCEGGCVGGRARVCVGVYGGGCVGGYAGVYVGECVGVCGRVLRGRIRGGVRVSAGGGQSVCASFLFEYALGVGCEPLCLATDVFARLRASGSSVLVKGGNDGYLVIFRAFCLRRPGELLLNTPCQNVTNARALASALVLRGGKARASRRLRSLFRRRLLCHLAAPTSTSFTLL